MSVHELERMLWRYEYGRLHSSSLEIALRDEVQRLVDIRAAQGSPAAAEMLWQATDVFARRDSSLRAAISAIDAHRFRDAVRELRRASEAIAAAVEFLEAGKKAAAAEGAVEAVAELAAADVLRQLPAVASLHQLMHTITSRMSEGQSRPAAALAELCARMATPLLVRRPLDGAEQAGIETRIAAIAELYATTSAVAADSEGDARCDGSLERLRILAREQHVDLARRLLTELEISLASRRRFRLHVQRALTDAESAHLKALVTSHSWDAAVDHLTSQDMARESATLALHASRAASAAANLEAVLEEETQEA